MLHGYKKIFYFGANAINAEHNQVIANLLRSFRKAEKWSAVQKYKIHSERFDDDFYLADVI